MSLERPASRSTAGGGVRRWWTLRAGGVRGGGVGGALVETVAARTCVPAERAESAASATGVALAPVTSAATAAVSSACPVRRSRGRPGRAACLAGISRADRR